MLTVPSASWPAAFDASTPMTTLVEPENCPEGFATLRCGPLTATRYGTGAVPVERRVTTSWLLWPSSSTLEGVTDRVPWDWPVGAGSWSVVPFGMQRARGEHVRSPGQGVCV